MSPARLLSVWILVTVCASSLLVGVLHWTRGNTGGRWGTFKVGNPETGSQLFKAKGCDRCHAVNGIGGGMGPDLGGGGARIAGPDHIASVLWNHAPAMWERMDAARMEQHRISQEEMAHLFAYLYTIQYADPPGQAAAGQVLFETKGCARCHTAAAMGTAAPSNRRPLDGEYPPVAWARAMWNHSHETSGGEANPKFAGTEMPDLLAYVRSSSRSDSVDPLLMRADPDRGWKLFKEKSCTKCHSLRDEAGRSAPELGPGRELPATLLQLAGSMWNHAPAMQDAMKERGVARPMFETGEMADLIAFLYVSRYYEPGGSPKVGEVLFVGRGCSNCHGQEARGGGPGPGLRGRGRSYSSVALAAALWDHGPEMRREARDQNLPWPTLATHDVGDILAFLNSSPE